VAFAQAKELLDHLEDVLSNEPVEVVAGSAIVEVKPAGVSKGGAVERILLEAAAANTAHDVVLCIGDDRSDEDMYIAIEHVAVMPHMPAEVSP
jgi:trehalose 6-phosphate synthase/phosphatase